MKRTSIFTIVIAIICFVFNSCEKENSESLAQLTAKSSHSSIQAFDSMEQAFDEAYTLGSMSYEKFIAYEKAHNYNSFGKLAYAALDDITKDSTISLNEFYELLNKYPDYVHIEKYDGEEYLNIKYDNTPFTLIMNEDRMFIVDTLVYKVFENRYIACNINLFDRLLNMTDAEAELLEEGGDFLIYNCKKNRYNGMKGNYGTSLSVNATNSNGKEKVVVEVYIDTETRSVNGCVQVTNHMGCKTKGYRKALGTFWPVQRHVASDITGILCTYTSEKTGHYSGAEFTYTLEGPITVDVVTLPYGVSNHNSHIGAAIGYGQIPAVTRNLNFQY